MTQIQEMASTLAPLFKKGEIISTQVIKSGILSTQIKGGVELVFFLLLLIISIFLMLCSRSDFKNSEKCKEYIKKHSADIGPGCLINEDLHKAREERVSHCNDSAMNSTFALGCLVISIPFLYCGVINLATPVYQLFQNLIGN